MAKTTNVYDFFQEPRLRHFNGKTRLSMAMTIDQTLKRQDKQDSSKFSYGFPLVYQSFPRFCRLFPPVFVLLLPGFRSWTPQKLLTD